MTTQKETRQIHKRGTQLKSIYWNTVHPLETSVMCFFVSKKLSNVRKDNPDVVKVMPSGLSQPGIKLFKCLTETRAETVFALCISYILIIYDSQKFWIGPEIF